MAESDLSDDATSVSELAAPGPARMPSYYVNSINVVSSPFDFMLTVGQLSAGESTVEVVYEPLARVILSPQHAKVLSELLVEKVAQYEDMFGQLPSREKMVAIAKAAQDAAASSSGDETAEGDSPSEPEQPS